MQQAVGEAERRERLRRWNEGVSWRMEAYWGWKKRMNREESDGGKGRFRLVRKKKRGCSYLPRPLLKIVVCVWVYVQEPIIN